MCFFKQKITKEKCKAKAIQVDVGILTHIPAYSGMFRYPKIRNYLSIFRTFITLVIIEPWHIQNPGIFRTLTYSEAETYSEP